MANIQYKKEIHFIQSHLAQEKTLENLLKTT